MAFQRVDENWKNQCMKPAIISELSKSSKSLKSNEIRTKMYSKTCFQRKLSQQKTFNVSLSSCVFHKISKCAEFFNLSSKCKQKSYNEFLHGMIRMKGILTGSSAKILQYSMNLHKGPKNLSRSLFAQPRHDPLSVLSKGS